MIDGKIATDLWLALAGCGQSRWTCAQRTKMLVDGLAFLK